MKDLTDGSIAKNILQMAVPIAAGMFFQTLYFLIDLYFVSGLGDSASDAVQDAAFNAGLNDWPLTRHDPRQGTAESVTRRSLLPPLLRRSAG